MMPTHTSQGSPLAVRDRASAPLDLAQVEKEALHLHGHGLPSLFNIPVPDFLPSSPTEAPLPTRSESPSPEHIRELLEYDSVELEDPTNDDRDAVSPPPTCASDMDISPVA